MNVSGNKRLGRSCYKVIVNNCGVCSHFSDEYGDNMFDCIAPHFFELNLQQTDTSDSRNLIMNKELY
jgi:hypothetical protein